MRKVSEEHLQWVQLKRFALLSDELFLYKNGCHSLDISRYFRSNIKLCTKRFGDPMCSGLRSLHGLLFSTLRAKVGTAGEGEIQEQALRESPTSHEACASPIPSGAGSYHSIPWTSCLSWSCYPLARKSAPLTTPLPMESHIRSWKNSMHSKSNWKPVTPIRSANPSPAAAVSSSLLAIRQFDFPCRRSQMSQFRQIPVPDTEVHESCHTLVRVYAVLVTCGVPSIRTPFSTSASSCSRRGFLISSSPQCELWLDFVV